MKRTILVAAALIMTVFATHANNVTVANASLTGQDVTAGLNNAANFTNVKFDVSWDNSWRVSGTGTPNNWDAVWVFVKYKEAGSGQLFQHAKISTDPAHHSVGTTNGVGATITPSPDGMGVFIHRSADGNGSINWQDIQLRWMYRQSPNAVHDTMNVTIQVFAIEMVYIPEGSFYLGDGNMSFAPSSNAFRVNNQAPTIPKGYEAYLVQSEAAITFLNSSSTSLTSAYDPTSYTSVTYTLPAAFPKGYAAFYIMKYEVSQKQYVDFFNTLNSSTTTQKSNRNIANSGSFRNDFNWNGTAGNDATLLNGNSGDRGQNFLGWADACAYSDWAGLRPMSEMEYEKASRGNAQGIGPIYPIRLEYAWGNTTITNLTGTLTNDGTVSEGVPNPSTNNANALYSGGISGPVRNGIFAAKNFTTDKRQQSGASYYGVMELSGNLSEMVVATFAPYYSSCTYMNNFTSSIHGDGVLSTSGNANIDSWTNGTGVGEVTNSPSYSYTNCTNARAGNIAKLKGGSYGNTTTYLRTSDRSLTCYWQNASYPPRGSYSTTTSTTSATNADVYQRNQYHGFRAVRTAP